MSKTPIVSPRDSSGSNEAPAPAFLPRALPTRAQTLAFEAKAWGLRMQRLWHDAGDGARPRRHPAAGSSGDAPVLAELDSPLWPCEEEDLSHVTGKLQNLRVALRALDGIEVPARATFSFWKQLGRATRRRGYVSGRELREGCIIPAIGGGLCQLSNAVYDCARRAGFEIVERHPHSRALPGSLAEQDRDATVFWNYIDLRVRAPFAWRLEVDMDERQLHVRIRGHAPVGAQQTLAALAPRPPQPTNDCATCGQVRCHLHTGPSGIGLRRAWWMQEPWPEFEAYLRAQAGAAPSSAQQIWRAAEQQRLWHRAWQAAQWRYGRWRGRALPRLRLVQMERAAREFARRLQPQDVDLVLPQSLLPFLWRTGELAGRRFAVMMTALPMTTLQAQLDRAAARQPQGRSLRDFRADPALVQAEAQALRAASVWLSAHARILDEAGTRAHALAWQLPPATQRAPRRAGPPRIFFAASPLARKGVFELLEALRDEAVEILLPPGDSEARLDAGRATLRRVASYRAGLDAADLVVLPAWVEHQPRALLAAIADGIPVIATPECGLGDALPWRCVQAGDVQGLRAAIRAVIEPPLKTGLS